jgi:5'-methylthioinosine phosphorylase
MSRNSGWTPDPTMVDGGNFAIIAGSGFGSFADDAPGKPVDTEYGTPSGPIRELRYADHTVLFLPRHGDDLMIPPHAINYRANLKALSLSGIDSVIALNTVGVIKPKLYPGQVAIPDQLIDYTWGRASSIYDGALPIDHVDFTAPFSAPLREALLKSAQAAGVAVVDGGVYAVTQGPRLETSAEVDRLERDGVDYVGMTAMPEAVLARELGMDYACVSLIVNFAAGRGEKPIHDDLEAGTMTAKMQTMKLLREFFGAIDDE